jgi:NADPH-dependent 2,4-dienoyl-CoA reductase/sulfur reductase-like enzyme
MENKGIFQDNKQDDKQDNKIEQKEKTIKNAELVIIGGGPAGLAAAIGAREKGIDDIIILEREVELGGILKQCIHTGFGLKIFKEELTGPEYADRFIKEIKSRGIEFKLDTMVINLEIEEFDAKIKDAEIKDVTKGYKIVTAVNKKDGLIKIRAKAVILAMGCRERTRGSINIPGTRPAGIFTAGTAQRFVNIEGYLPGKKVVILGSGDIGLIMARRMTLEGAKVKMVCELMPYPGGLNRNIVQCLEDFNIPLKLGYTIVKIHGKKRIEGVTIAKVGNDLKPEALGREYVECDTLLLSVGLIPENELSIDAGIEIDKVTAGPVVNESMETSIGGLFACGNVVHVHDLVDMVTKEAYLAGKNSARYILEWNKEVHEDYNVIKIVAGQGVRYIIPHKIRKEFLDTDSKLLFRVKNVYMNVRISLIQKDKEIYSAKKTKVLPGEMESIKLTKQILNKIDEKKDIIVQIQSI